MSTTESTPLIGIVTVLYNCDEVLQGFFESLAAQIDVCFHLYVIDNGSTESGAQLSTALASKYGIAATVVFNNHNAGVARGNNQGIRLALADGCSYVLLANNDTEFAPATIRHLFNVLVDGSERAATPKMTYFDPPNQIWYGGGHINAWTMRTPHYGMREEDRGQYDKPRHVGYAPTCFLLFDAKIFEEIGLMDEAYFVYYDDTDFIWRMAAQGIRLRYVPASVVKHKVSSSTGGGESPFSLYYTNRNRLYFIRKNLRGWRKAAALAYMLMTRVPRLSLLPSPLSKRGWAGVYDGFKMALPQDTA
ncbi:MAG TPA: glycosyltransferase family 2 protein [Burkholderiaceae bacterium]|jgi:hypothetical protein